MDKKGEVYLFQLADSKMPDKTYEACAGHARMLIKDNLDRLYQHNFFEEYYRQIVSLFVDTDRKKINEARSDFNFKTVNDAYHLIDEATQAVFVRNYDEESQRLWESIRFKPYFSREDYRKMQPFCVSLYPSTLKKCESSYTVTEQGVYLWLGEYNNETGLQLEMYNDGIWIV